MLGALLGFAILGSIIILGYLVGRIGILGEHGRFVLSRITFFVLIPCLLFTVLAEADVHALFSSLLVVSLSAALIVGLTFALISRVFLRRAVSETVIGSLAAGYVNGNNVGIPVALYVLGDAAFSAHIILFQLLVLAPVALAILDVQNRGSLSVRRLLLQPITNPIIVASALGVLVAVLEIPIPAEVMEPFHIVGAAAIPLVLIGFGMSLHGQRPLSAASSRIDVFIILALKLIVMPLAAWLLGRFVVGLDGLQLFAVVVLAALPSAQNVFNYAQRYERGEVVARDSVLLTTVLSAPVILVIALLLAPH